MAKGLNMRVSFPPIHPGRPSAAERAARRDAEVFLLRSGARLIEALGLIHGEDGLALGYALRDMALDPGMPPSSWPLSEVLDALISSDPDIRCRTAGLRAALDGLRARIDASEEGSAADADGRAPNGIRDVA